MQEDAGDARAQGVPVVLDTNVVLDWHLFRDPRAAPLVAQLEAGSLRWHATSDMIVELDLVWPRSFGQDWEFRRTSMARSDILAWATICPVPARSAPPGLRCSDRSDQKFIDLALALPTCWLVSRDRAVLKLASRARGAGLNIVTPERWAWPGNAASSRPARP